MKIAFFGGTFNPVHYGHVFVANYLLELMELDKVVFVPSGLPPHKKNCIDKNHRSNMVSLAISGNENFSMSDYEIKKEGLSYTFDTMKHFNSKLPNDELYYIIGQDAFLLFDQWYRKDELIDLVHFIVMTRGKNMKDEITQRYGTKNISFADTPNIEISSTDIRHRVQSGRSIKYFVSERVEEYIRQNNLYL